METKKHERLQTALNAIVSSQLLADFFVAFERALSASPDETLLEFHRRFVRRSQQQHGLSGFPDTKFWLTDLPGMHLMYLFGALAIPKELLHAAIPETQREQLRDIRNALAHGNFQMGSSHISLWSEKKGRVDISKQQLSALNQLLVGVLAGELKKG